MDKEEIVNERMVTSFPVCMSAIISELEAAGKYAAVHTYSCTLRSFTEFSGDTSGLLPVKLAGGNNIAENKIDSYGPLSPEYILTSNPDTIFFAGANWANDAGNRVLIGFNVSPEQTWKRLTPYTKRTGWKKLNAIKNGEIYAVNHGGLRSIYDYVYVQYIAKSLYPELFEDIDPKENLENFYKKYLPITPEGTFMTKYNKK